VLQVEASIREITLKDSEQIGTNDSQPFSALVIQMGARRSYELARMLEQNGVLAALHTSTAWRDGEAPSRLFQLASRIDTGTIKRRTVLDIEHRKIRTTPLPEALGSFLSLLGIREESRYRAEDWLLGLSARLSGLAGASVVLNTAGNGGVGFLRWAKSQGVYIASDIVITPRVYDILLEEHSLWPGWEREQGLEANADLYRRNMEKLVGVSDLLLSPSETVDDGLATVAGFDENRLVRVPYGLGAATLLRGTPIPRRVLFAGHAGLRKGIPYLAEAARLLKPLGYDFRVAGNATEELRSRLECEALRFLGHLGPDEMLLEFCSADVFCLPSLAEGMASVTLEALACGVPCIVTRSAGSPVRHGHDGLIVPERNGVAIAEAIKVVVEDRHIRDRMSKAGLVTASTHALDSIGGRLFHALERLKCHDS
jgi:glycosyltransferase involved in cell wall biosynthesis